MTANRRHRCVGFIEDVIGEDWQESVFESIWNHAAPPQVVMGLGERRWRMLARYGRTRQEERILKGLGEGLTAEQIAEQMNLTPHRIRQIARAVFERVTGQTEPKQLDLDLF